MQSILQHEREEFLPTRHRGKQPLDGTMHAGYTYMTQAKQSASLPHLVIFIQLYKTVVNYEANKLFKVLVWSKRLVSLMTSDKKNWLMSVWP